MNLLRILFCHASCGPPYREINFSSNVLIYTGHPKHSRNTQLKSAIITQTCMGGWLASRNSNFRVYLSREIFDLNWGESTYRWKRLARFPTKKIHFLCRVSFSQYGEQTLNGLTSRSSREHVATFNTCIIPLSLFHRDRFIREEMRTRNETSKEIRPKMITKHF